MKRFVSISFTFVFLILIAFQAQAQKIIWVAGNIQDAGGVDSDQGFVDLLEANGYEVQRENDTMAGGSLTAEQRAVLESGDLVIISRSTSSGSYNTLDWNTISTPILNTTCYLARDSRWKWFNNSTLIDDGGAPMYRAAYPEHPVFAGITLDDSMEVAAVDGAVGSGNTSLNQCQDIGNGVVLATAGNTGDIQMAYWNAGVLFHDGTDQAPAGPRLLFNCGARETASGVEPAYLQGLYNLTPAGDQLFLNAVAFMINVRVVHSWVQDFEGEVDLDFWRPNKTEHPDGTPVFDVSLEDGALKVVMKQLNFPDGQMYDALTKNLIFDLTKYPLWSLKIKVEPGAKYAGADIDAVPFMGSPFSKEGAGQTRQHSNPTVNVPDDGQWYDVLFDWRTPDADQTATPNVYTNITRFLLEVVKWPDTHEATFWIDDVRIGRAALPAGSLGKIIWVSGNIQDSTGVDTDQGFVNMLEAAGYEVQRENDTMAGNPLTEEQKATLMSSDLIIVSRSTNSGSYNNTEWNTIEKPLILTTSYLSRASRWQWLDNSDILGGGDSGAPLYQVEDPNHPIFENVTLDADNQFPVLDPTVGSGNTSLPGQSSYGFAQLLATVADTGTVAIAYWDWDTQFHPGTDQVAAGPRLLFNCGTREHSGMTDQGLFNLTLRGIRTFVNAVDWMISLEKPPTDITDLMGVVAGQNDHLPWNGPSSDGSPDGERIHKLIDNDVNTKYLVGAEQVWIEYTIHYLALVTGYSLTSANDAPARDPRSWEFQGWDAEARSWVTLHTVTDHPEWPERFQKESFFFENSAWYNKYRLNITAINGDAEGLMQIAELEIFGELSDTVVPEEMIQITRVSHPPIIDGVLDQIWYNAGENRDYLVIPAGDDPDPVNDWFDIGLSFRAMYDAENLYVFMSVKDEDLNRDSGDSWWEDDSYELYIDGDNSKGQTYDGVNDKGFHWSYNADTILDPDPSGWETMGVVQTDYGIDLEVALPLEKLGIIPEPGNKIGIEVQWNEDDGGTDRDAKVQFFASVDEAWQNPSYMGTAELQAGALYPELAVHQTYAAPTIDGEMDELWYNFPLISSNNYPEVSGGIANLAGGWMDASYKYRIAWDPNNIYMYIAVKDETWVRDSADAWYNDDAVELYIDSNNSKGATYDGVDDWGFHWSYNEADVVEPTGASGLGPVVDFTPIQYGAMFTEDGLALELALPMEFLLLNPEVGQQFGFELDWDDDDDGGDRDTKVKYFTTVDDSWQYPSTLGTAVLAGPTRTDVEEDANAIVTTYELRQNYPNPFNPSTTIEFALPQNDHVTLTVYDILGREVMTLVDKQMDMGRHTLTFNASSFATGVYFYRLQTNNFIETKKMMLLK